MKKKFYLYHQTRNKLNVMTFVFYAEFDSHELALKRAEEVAKNELWTVWKIEEVYKFNPPHEKSHRRH